MKSLLKIFALLFLVALWACEKNDPLADQGDLTGATTPFILLAQMPDAAVGDTITLRTVCWAVDDNIAKVSFYHEGFKLRTYEVKLTIEGNNNVVHNIETTLLEDSVLFEQSHIADYPENGKSMTDYYQTYDNAYVFLHDFIVPERYALTRKTNEELIMAMDDVVFDQLVIKFSMLFNRGMMIVVFPEINPFSLDYFVIDDGGNYTGEITDLAVEYIIENLNRELLITFLNEARVSDNTRVVIESVATLDDNATSAASRRMFRVL